MASRTAEPTTVDAAEVARFSALASTWWDADGPMRALHRLNPTRLSWLKVQLCKRFARDTKDASALAGLRMLDIGCGGGILAEPLARMGAEVTGIDPSPETIAAAKHHAAAGGLTIDYRAATAEALAEAGERFDVVTILEVVEHVTDVASFVAACARLVKPGGLVIASTINRTMKAFVLAIVGAEYVLGWLPRGTHSYDKLVTPSELAAAFGAAGLTVIAETGVMYVPFAGEWRLTADMDVNYMMAAGRTQGDLATVNLPLEGRSKSAAADFGRGYHCASGAITPPQNRHCGFDPPPRGRLLHWAGRVPSRATASCARSALSARV